MAVYRSIAVVIRTVRAQRGVVFPQVGLTKLLAVSATVVFAIDIAIAVIINAVGAGHLVLFALGIGTHGYVAAKATIKVVTVAETVVVIVDSVGAEFVGIFGATVILAVGICAVDEAIAIVILRVAAQRCRILRCGTTDTDSSALQTVYVSAVDVGVAVIVDAVLTKGVGILGSWCPGRNIVTAVVTVVFAVTTARAGHK